MRTLTVNKFSCIDEAALELGHLTALIGPQASGKSVLSKLVYFFADIMSPGTQAASIVGNNSIEIYKQTIKKQFNDLFPFSAWGKKSFQIKFEAGEDSVTINRSARSNSTSTNLRVIFSPSIEEDYNRGLKANERSFGGSKRSRSALTEPYQREWTIHRFLTTLIKARIKSDFVQYQLFIPAGRSFFTSTGKAISVFEHVGTLDPIVTRFGKYFSSIRERRLSAAEAKRSSRVFRDVTATLLGGHPQIEKDASYNILSPDGRKVAFSVMSSGQQELLPLLVILEDWIMIDPTETKNVYIEEPEAHLFPQAQCAIVELFARILNLVKNTNLLITTHSPYILAKINNLIKAHEVAASRDGLSDKVAQIVPKDSWIDPAKITAYAIVDQCLESIIDHESKLIDGDYLDDVSSHIGAEFSRLLDIEAGSLP